MTEPEKEEKYIRSTDEAVDAMKNMDLTGEEYGKFEKAFKDPEFMKMFVEYAKEIESPEAKAETDAYLRQVENEGRTKEVYGDNVVMIMPTAGFVVKTKKKESDQKVFINVCYSDKGLDKATSVKQGGGTAWDIPFSLSAIRKEKDNKGEECDTHDFVIHSETFEKCQSSAVFQKFICQTAIENVEQQRYSGQQGCEKCALDRRFKVPNIKFKGPTTGPSVMATKKVKAGETPGPEGTKIMPEREPSNFGGIDIPDMAEQDRKLRELTKKQEEEDKKKREEELKSSNTRSDFSLDFKKKAKKPTQEAPEVGLVTPKYELVHRGTLDLQEAWDGAADGREKLRNTVPKALVLRVMLPRLEGINGVDLDVNSTRVLLTKTDMYRLDLKLPYKVDDAKGKAKFDKAKRMLELTLPVIPPPAPPQKTFVEPVKMVEEIDEAEDKTEEGKENVQPLAGEPPTEEKAQASSNTEAPTESNPETSSTPAVTAEETLSENERKWKESMTFHDEKRRVAEAAATKAELEKQIEHAKRLQEEGEPTTAEEQARYDKVPKHLTEEFFSSQTFEGQRLGYVFKKGGDEGRIGYYRDALEVRKYEALAEAASASEATASAQHAPDPVGARNATAVMQPVAKPAKPETGHVLAPRLFGGDVLELD